MKIKLINQAFLREIFSIFVLSVFLISCNRQSNNSDQKSIQEINLNVKKTNVLSIGEKLFFDKNLSVNQTISCSTCHIPKLYYTNQLPTGVGVNNFIGSRNVPSLLELKYYNEYFWDGRETNLKTLILQPIKNNYEMGNSNSDKIQKISVYLNNNYKINLDQAQEELKNYILNLPKTPSPLENYLNGDAKAISGKAILGYKIFLNKGQCTQCHTFNGNNKSLTDNQLHPNFFEYPKTKDVIELAKNYLSKNKNRYSNANLGEIIVQDPLFAEMGGLVRSNDINDIRSFRTPSLWNVEKTYPYFHNGSVTTLKQAVEWEIYSKLPHDQQNFSEEEKAEIEEFLKSLTNPIFQ